MKDKDRSISIYVNQIEYKTNRKGMTGAEIRALAIVPVDHELFEVRGNRTIPLKKQQMIHLRDKLNLRAIPGETSESWRLIRPQ